MLRKCANPACPAAFRKLGTGKLFTFESVSSAYSSSAPLKTISTKMDRAPVFFWLCEGCSLSYTVGLDEAGDLILQKVRDEEPIAIFDAHPLVNAG